MIDYLVSENAQPMEDTTQESNEIPDVTKEPTPLVFTHEETTDLAGFYFNDSLQNAIGRSQPSK